MVCVLSIVGSANFEIDLRQFPKVKIEAKSRETNLEALATNPDQLIRYLKDVLHRNASVKNVIGMLTNGTELHLYVVAWKSLSSFSILRCETPLDLS